MPVSGTSCFSELLPQLLFLKTNQPQIINIPKWHILGWPTLLTFTMEYWSLLAAIKVGHRFPGAHTVAEERAWQPRQVRGRAPGAAPQSVLSIGCSAEGPRSYWPRSISGGRGRLEPARNPRGRRANSGCPAASLQSGAGPGPTAPLSAPGAKHGAARADALGASRQPPAAPAAARPSPPSAGARPSRRRRGMTSLSRATGIGRHFEKGKKIPPRRWRRRPG